MTQKNNEHNIEKNEVNGVNQKLSHNDYWIGLVKFIFFTGTAIVIFFIPFEIEGNSEILFGYIYNQLIAFFGIIGIWAICLTILLNALTSLYAKLIAKEKSRITKYYQNETMIHVMIYILAAIYVTLYTLDFTFNQFHGPELIVGESTGELIIDIALAVFWVIPLGAVFIPFFVNYGAIDFVGTILQPIMRPIFKVPGKSAVDAITSFLTSSSVAVLFTSKLYNLRFYTVKEAATIATSFSAVSIGFAAVVINTAGLMEHFTKVYFSSFFIAFIIAIIMVRIPPLSLKANIYKDGSEQTKEERKADKYTYDTLQVALNVAVRQARYSKNFLKETFQSLMEGLSVLPKVMCMLFAIGVTIMIIAEHTPIFDYIGLILAPILQLFQVPNAIEIAPSLTLGIAEMFLPVLYIADMVDTLDIGARYFVTVVSMVQIIFFAETGAVMMSTGLPLKLWELIVIFFIRTIIAIPIVALFTHLFF